MADSAGTILVIDDDRLALQSISILLHAEGFTVRSFEDGTKALASFREAPADVVLTDINMPIISGMKVLEEIRSFDSVTPVVIMTGNAELEMALTAIRMRASEFILKPIVPADLITAIENWVHHKRLHQLEKTYKAELEQAVVKSTCELVEALELQKKMSREIIERLTAAAELRDEATGMHISRIGRYAGKMAEVIGMPYDFMEMITVASSMHDIGKIGIPDAILFKPGKLTPAEFEVIKNHTIIGYQILRGSSHPLLQMASSIAISHHERWDGTGYPYGIAGDAIPLEGRIVMLVDQYDALRSSRVYKKSMTHDHVLRIIAEGDDLTRPAHFDPALLKAFKETAAFFEETFDAFKELEGKESPPFNLKNPEYRIQESEEQAKRLCI